MHVAAATELNQKLIPALEKLRKVLKKNSENVASIHRIAQTHLTDVPTPTIQDYSQYINLIIINMQSLINTQTRLHQLKMIGNTDGTPNDFRTYVVRYLSVSTGIPFIDAPNDMEQLHTYNIMVEMSSILNTLSTSLSE